MCLPLSTADPVTAGEGQAESSSALLVTLNVQANCRDLSH